MNRLFLGVLIGLFAMAILSCRKQKESAEQPAKETKIEAAQVKEAIQTYIDGKTAPAGTFAIEDQLENRTRELTFAYVHDSVHETEDGRYYACVDFTEAPADTLDLDFYVALDPNGKANVSDVVIHKVNGVSRL